jgi:beta-glucanase (GH16 family)
MSNFFGFARRMPKRGWKARALFVFLTFAMTLTVSISDIPHSSKVQAAVPPTPSGWSLTFSDDFTAGAGTGVNATNWQYDLGTSYPGGAGNWGTGEIETMTNSTANVYHDGAGNLAIKPIRAANGTWTSGRIETKRTDFQPAAGGVMRIEASIQMPNVTGAAAQGYWPAFWTLGAPFRGNYNNWPSVGEIDIMENVNGANTVWGTLHCGVSPGGPCNETSGIGGNRSGFAPSLQAGFHKYAVEFDKSVSPQQLRWYVDGIQYHTVNANQVDATTWNNATNHGFFVILNVAIGGGWPGGPTGSTASGVPMLVDYVAVWNKAGGGGTTPTPTPNPTPTPTPTGGSGFTQGVDNVSTTATRFWFQPSGWTANYVILHYLVPGQVQQNVNAAYNSGAARWEYTANNLPRGQAIQYWYTYNKGGVQSDTAHYTYTKP